MQVTRKIISGLEIFEKYNEKTVPWDGTTKITMRVQEVEFRDISNEDTKLLNSYGWYNSSDAPYLWALYK